MGVFFGKSEPAKPEAKAGKISCLCGKSALHLVRRDIRWSFKCACFDCLQKAEWCAYASQKSTHPWKVQIVPQLLYYENNLSKVEGEENLRAYQLRKTPEGGHSSQFIVAKCCHSLLAIDHPGYKQNVFMTIPDGNIIDADKMDPPMWISLCDRQKGNAADDHLAVKEFEESGLTNFNTSEVKELSMSLILPWNWWKLFTLVYKIGHFVSTISKAWGPIDPVYKDAGSDTIQKLLGRLGVKVLNLEEGKRFSIDEGKKAA